MDNPTSIFSAENDEEIFTHRKQNISWRNIIFIPFNTKWRVLILISVVYHINDALSQWCYRSEPVSESRKYFFLIMEIIYGFHTIFLTMHRCMKTERMKEEYEPKQIYLLIIDYITLIPVFKIYKAFSDFSWQNENETGAKLSMRNYWRLIVLLRYYEIINFLNYLDHVLTSSHKVSFIKFVFHSYFINSLLGCFWFLLGCYHCKERNWTETIENYEFDRNDAIHWEAISFIIMLRLYLNHYESVAIAITIREKLFFILVMTIGYVAVYFVLFGMLKVAFIRSFRCQLKYLREINVIKMIVNRWNMEKKTRKKLFYYYHFLWEKKRGILHFPKSFYTLPQTLQRDAALDMNWDALQHSLVFKKTSLAFKRAISMAMTHITFMAGDYLLKQDTTKFGMIYIKSGLVQILSAEDDDSVVISFSAGTVLCEINLFLPTKNKVYVRCATYTEIIELELLKLAKVLSFFPLDKVLMYEEINNRLRFTKMMYKHKKKFANATKIDKSGIRWLKIRSRKINAAKKRQTLKVNPMHTSEYLSLYSIKEGIELRTQVICLRGSFPFLLDPSSGCRNFCTYLVVLLFFIECTLTPYYIAFVGEIPFTLITVLTIFDIFYICDIILQLSTAIKLKDSMITSHSQILLYKIKSFSFIVDLITAIPANQLANMVYPSGNYSWLRTIKCLRGYQFIELIHRKTEKNVHSLYLRFFRYLFIFFYSTYWWSCIFYVYTCYNGKCKPHGWYAFNVQLQKEAGLPIPPSWNHPFLMSYLYVIAGYVNIGITHFEPYSLDDIVLTFLFLNVIGYSLRFLFFGELNAIMFFNNQRHYYHKHTMKVLQKHLVANHIDKAKVEEILWYLDFKWDLDRLTTLDYTMKYIPINMRETVIKERMMSAMKNIPLFEFLGPVIVNEFLNIMTVVTLAPNTIICHNNSHSHILRILSKGFVKIESILLANENHKTDRILKHGDLIVAVETMHQSKTLVKVSTITACEWGIIPMDKFWRILEHHIEKRDQLKRILKDHMDEFDYILKKQRVRLPRVTTNFPSHGQENVFQYDVMIQKREMRRWREYITPFQQIGKWYWLRFLMISNGISPTGKFFITWEICRSIVLFIKIMLTLNLFTIIFPSVQQTMYYISLAYNLVDLYIRCHCHYYAQNGLLVTHPISCFKHYFKTSFIVDLIAYLPITTLYLDNSFGSQNYCLQYNFASMIMLLLQTHRIFEGLAYLQRSYRSNTLAFVLIRFCLISNLILATLALFFLSMACQVDKNNNKMTFKCSENSWIGTSKHFEVSDIDKWSSLLFSYDITTDVALGSSSNTFRSNTTLETVAVSLLTALFFFPVITLGVNLVGHMAGGDVALTVYRQRVKTFLIFMKTSITPVHEDIIKAAINHYEHISMITKGANNNKLYSFLNIHSKEEICLLLYGKILENTQLLTNTEEDNLRILAPLLEEKFFERNADIIRCNDVQKSIYIVKSGRVNIIVAKNVISTLGPGGMFGCFQRHGETRQLITATAKIHISLLEINCRVFYKVFKNDPKVMLHLKQLNFINAEFLQPVEVLHDNQTYVTIMSENRNSSKNKRNILRFGKVISHQGTFYSWCQYILCVFIIPLSTLILLFVIFIEHDRSMTLFDKIFVYTLDALFIINMIVDSQVDFIDEESGLVVKNLVQIRKMYFLRISKFWFHLFTVLPLELLAGVFTPRAKYFCINRLLRYNLFIMYYVGRKRKVQIMATLRLIYIVNNFLLSIQCSACIWYLAICSKTCLDLKNRENVDINSKEILIESYVVLYKSVFNRLCRIRRYEEVTNQNRARILTEIFLVLFFELVNLWMISEFLTVIIVSSHNISDFKHKLYKLKAHFEQYDIFPRIKEVVYEYLYFLGRRESGQQIPWLIENAPRFLQQDLLYSLYGHHLLRHFLFKETHTDFVKQISVHLKRNVFKPGNYLVKLGDVDGRLFFIEEGEVEAYDEIGDIEVLKFTLVKNDTFGEEQSLHLTPHRWSYKAKRVVVALMLKKADWDYLLPWFPASNDIIQRNSNYLKTTRRVTS